MTARSKAIAASTAKGDNKELQAPLHPKHNCPRDTGAGCRSLGAGADVIERPVASGLSGIRKLCSVLKAANLLTPDLVLVLEELAQLVPQDTGGSPEQAGPLSRSAELSEAPPAKRTKWSCDDEASVTVCGAPVLSPTPQCLQQPAPFSGRVLMASSPIESRKSGLGGASPSGPRRSVKRQLKRQQGCGKAAEIPSPESPGTSWLEAGAPASPGSPVPLGYTPKSCPAPVPQSRVPPAVSAAQNLCSPPAHELNVTFEVCPDSRSPSAIGPLPVRHSECLDREKSQCQQAKQEGPFMPRAPIPALAMKSSSIPKAPALKRRRVERASLGEQHPEGQQEETQGTVPNPLRPPPANEALALTAPGSLPVSLTQLPDFFLPLRPPCSPTALPLSVSSPHSHPQVPALSPFPVPHSLSSFPVPLSLSPIPSPALDVFCSR
ncbi:kinesin-like protein KIF18B [Lathamus discolor]|uniref:kinesin-like protein KIF18B n=1 Tax=Lathamus discolor TaxID=678569 RepID=UPI0032B78931